VFVAFDEGTAVGLITVKRSGLGSASIGLLSVLPAWQRKHVGAQLVSTACAWAIRAGATSIEVTTQRENEGAVSFYSKCGFKVMSETAIFHLWLKTLRSIPQNVPYFTGRELSYLKTSLDNRRIESCGAHSTKCQEQLQAMLNSDLVLLTGSGTSALEEAAILCNLKPGDEVIMPSYTFVSTANAFVLRGATPVFVDVRSDTLNIDETKIEAAITPKTKAIVVVHYAGIACEMDVIMDISKRHNLIVIEDAAHAILSKYKGRYCGTIGDMGCFSFHYTKNIICGEGGALSINNPIFRDRSLIVWEKGTNRFDFIQKRVDKYAWVDIGSSFVPSEINASFLLAQLEQAEDINGRRMRVAHAYYTLLSPLQEAGRMRLMPVEAFEHNGHIFWIILSSPTARDGLQAVLSSRQVQGYSHYVPLHRSPAGELLGRTTGGMTNTDTAGSSLLRLPLWPHMTWVDVYHVVCGVYEWANAAQPRPRAAACLFHPSSES
jgi:dTDP-4-amino-4,6-dideoxygalactose transaminase